MGELLGGKDLQVAVDRTAGQMGCRLASTVQHQHARGAERGGHVGRGGVGDVVGDEPDTGRSRPGRAVRRNSGARWAYSVRRPSQPSSVTSGPTGGARAGS